jgi:fermentation-respiration switch protein FrsA (DUF1100 family)
VALAIALPLLDRLIYFPERDMGGPPPPGVEERWLTTEDGVKIHAWLARATGTTAEAAPTLIWSHGNAGNIAHRVGLQLALARRGLNVLAYDYRGYGQSEGQPSEEGLYRDAQAAYDSERARGVAADTIVCFGESLGGAVSIDLAIHRRCAAVAVVSTFSSIADVARVHYGILGFLAGNRFDAASRVSQIDVPFFQAHGDLDEIIPFQIGEALHAAVRAPKRFLPVRGAMHNDIFLQESLLDAIAAFAREATGKGEERESPG